MVAVISGTVVSDFNSSTTKLEPKGPPEKPPGLGTRHCQAFMTFLSTMLAYTMRVNLSVGIVAMTDQKGSNPNYKVLPWTISQQGIILSAFFWGYMIPQVMAGHLARKFGPKYLLLGSMTMSSITTFLNPYIAMNCNWIIYCLTRMLIGFSQGFLLPCVNTHLAKWAPPPERNRTFSFVFGGSQVGTVLTMVVAGYLAASPWGWPSIFYCTAACSLAWCVVWLFLGGNCPDTHSSISDSEREYIKSTLISSSDDSKNMPTPWRQIFTSGPVWILLIVHSAETWCFWMLLTMLPNYLRHVLNFDIKKNGLISSLPYLGMWIMGFVFSWVADYVLEKRILPLDISRKMWNTIAFWGGAASLVALSVVHSVSGSVVLLTLGVSLNAAIYVGFLSNHLDLSPNFAGLLMGITNGISTIFAILAPMVTGFIVTDQTNREEWMIAFYISAGLFFFGNLVFVIFGTTEVQRWNDPLVEVDSEKPSHSINT
uniref:Putative inorganic phosphate cotransporter n=1 Tax=Cuerna arida TaxID=1464854 RepID=A0A1B6F5L1_9HEMI